MADLGDPIRVIEIQPAELPVPAPFEAPVTDPIEEPVEVEA
jgi:hypothetical protein